MPALLPKVKALHHYVRGKTWISPQLSEDILKSRTTETGEHNFEYTQAEIDSWRKDPEAYMKYRTELELRLQSFWELSQKDSLRHHTARLQYETNMRKRLERKPELLDQILPSYPPLCKRLTPGPGYLEALCADNTTVVSDPILQIDSEAIVTNYGTRRVVDAIICATGFETRPGFGFPIYGRDGFNLRTKYSSRPRSYLGLCTDNFPNFFQSLGPNAFQGAGSLLIQIEYTHRYMAQILAKLAYGNVRMIEPKRKAVNAFTDFCDAYFKQTVYLSDCASWYKADGRVSVLWPGSSTHAIRTLSSVRWEDFAMETYDSDEFGWFGDGTTMADRHVEEKNSEALTWYLANTKFLHKPLGDSRHAGVDLNTQDGALAASEKQEPKSDEVTAHVEIGNVVDGTPVLMFGDSEQSVVLPHGVQVSAQDQYSDYEQSKEDDWHVENKLCNPVSSPYSFQTQLASSWANDECESLQTYLEEIEVH